MGAGQGVAALRVREAGRGQAGRQKIDDLLDGFAGTMVSQFEVAVDGI